MDTKSKVRLRERLSVYCVCLLLLFGLLFVPQALQSDIGHRSKPVKGFTYGFDQWPYPIHAEINARLEELSKKYPKIARTINIGKTREGRDMMVIEIRRDYPVLAKINVSGAKLANGEAVKNIGHLLGIWSYIRYWIEGHDRSTKTVDWILESTGEGSIEVTVEAKSHKGGYDKKTITLKK